MEIKLQLLGAYSPTAPYDCPKSKAIFEHGCPNVTLKGIKNLALLRLEYLQLASLGSAAPLDEMELFELAKETLPGCEISTFHYDFKP